MNLRSIKRILYILTVPVFIGTYTSYAQPGDDPPNNPPVPISGIGYLLALGGALGVKKIYDIRKNHKD